MRLTDLSIKALKAPENGAIIHADDTLTGFGVRVSQAGTKSFVLTHGARRQRETIGRVGIISLAEARQEAKRRLSEYTLGKHKPRSIHWSVALDEYLADVKERRKESTHLEYERLLNRHFRYGELRLAEVSARDLQESMQKLPNSERFHAFTAVRPFLNWAYRKHYLDQNPIARMKAPEGSKPRSRILSDDEVLKVWRACEGDFGDLVKLLILTGQRVGEMASLTDDMLTAEAIKLPATLTKNGREHIFPIGPLTRRLARPVRFHGLSKAKAQLDDASGVQHWTLHDLRRTFASGLARLGVPIPVIERLLNHVSGTFAGIVGTYNRHDYWREMVDGVNLWDAHITKLTRPVKLVAA